MLTVSQLVKKFPRILWNLKLYNRVYNISPPVPVLSQISPV